MIVISQNGKVAVNIENLIAIEVQGNYIQAHPSNGGHAISIGAYGSDEEALNNFDKLMDSINESDDPETEILYMA